MGIFDTLKQYANKWSEKGRRNFTEEEQSEIIEAVVVDSQYGLSGKFTRRSGAVVYLPMDKNCTLGSGEAIDMAKAQLITLTKPGENDIFRVSL